MANTTNQTCTLELDKKTQNLPTNSFETIIIEAIEDSLSAFKRFNKQVFYSHLENTYKIKKEEIPFKIEEFTDAMEQIFGAGAKLIEIRIIQALHERIHDFVFFPQKKNLGLEEYLASLRTFLIRRVP
jgi:hypothetical protein